MPTVEEYAQLKGGEGADMLLGGDGGDLGGDGVDYLAGDEGNDDIVWRQGSYILDGGDGRDTYQVKGASFGSDLIRDSDGQGSIVVNGLTLSGGKRVTGELSEDAATGWDYFKAGDDLLVFNHAGNQNLITIKNWSSSRNQGIVLSDDAPTTNHVRANRQRSLAALVASTPEVDLHHPWAPVVRADIRSRTYPHLAA
jgi:Ca2+-binding RTX toxin-like protein